MTDVKEACSKSFISSFLLLIIVLSIPAPTVTFNDYDFYHVHISDEPIEKVSSDTTIIKYTELNSKQKQIFADALGQRVGLFDTGRNTYKYRISDSKQPAGPIAKSDYVKKAGKYYAIHGTHTVQTIKSGEASKYMYDGILYSLLGITVINGLSAAVYRHIEK